MADGPFSHTEIDMASEQAKDTGTMLFLPHLEYEPVLFHDNKHLVYSYLIAQTSSYSSPSAPHPQVNFHVSRRRDGR